MNIDRFRHLAETCGADLARWPVGERAAAQSLLAASAEARQALEQARALDVWLSLAAPAVDDARAEQVLAAIEGRLDLPAAAAWIPGADGGARRSPWPAAGFLVLMGVFGFVLGDLGLVTLWPRTATQAAGFTTLVASSSPSIAWDQ